MKTKTLIKKLVLSKETIADLTIGKMKGIHGGIIEDPVPYTDQCPGATATSCNCTGPTGFIHCPACEIC